MKILVGYICDKPIEKVWNQSWDLMAANRYDELWNCGFEEGWSVLREQVVQSLGGGSGRFHVY